MKKFKLLTLSALILSILLTSFSFAGENPENKKLTYDKIEANLLAGLESDNFGLMVGSAYMLGEIKSEKAVIPLIKLLRQSEDDRARLVAALALIKIDTEKSVYFVKQASKFNDVDKVRSLCNQLYNAHLASAFKGKEPTRDDLFAYLNIK